MYVYISISCSQDIITSPITCQFSVVIVTNLTKYCLSVPLCHLRMMMMENTGGIKKQTVEIQRLYEKDQYLENITW